MVHGLLVCHSHRLWRGSTTSAAWSLGRNSLIWTLHFGVNLYCWALKEAGDFGERKNGFSNWPKRSLKLITNIVPSTWQKLIKCFRMSERVDAFQCQTTYLILPKVKFLSPFTYTQASCGWPFSDLFAIVPISCCDIAWFTMWSHMVNDIEG